MGAKPSHVTRRHFLLSSVGVATILQLQHAARALGLDPVTQVCRLAAEQEQGPYYVADELLRSNIVEDRHGIPLSLRILVLHATTCKPLANAAVDLWHCDALGLYSGFTKQSLMGPGGPRGPRGDGPPQGPPPDFDPDHPDHFPGPPPPMGGGPPQNHVTDKLTFLRGIQLTGSDGSVNFQTVFPGFYMGRTNHIHFKVRVGGHATKKSYAAGHTSHTGQIFFSEQVAAHLMQHPPYSDHAIHRTTQEEDHVFTDQHGQLFIARLQGLHEDDFSSGMHADLVATVDPLATPAAVERRGGPGGGPFSGPHGPPQG